MLSFAEEIKLYSDCEPQLKKGSRSTYLIHPKRNLLRIVMSILNSNGFLCTQSGKGGLEVSLHQKPGRDFNSRGPEIQKPVRPEAVGDTLTKHIKSETPTIKPPDCPTGFYCVENIPQLFCWKLWYNDPVFGLQFEKVPYIQTVEKLRERIQDCEDCGLVPAVPSMKFMSFRELRLIWNDGELHVQQFSDGKERDDFIEYLIGMGLSRFVKGKKGDESDNIETWLVSDKMNIR